MNEYILTTKIYMNLKKKKKNFRKETTQDIQLTDCFNKMDLKKSIDYQISTFVNVQLRKKILD